MEQKPIRKKELVSHIEEHDGCLFFYIPMNHSNREEWEKAINRRNSFILLVNER